MAESLPCQTLAYRAMARKNWIDKQANRVLPAAYIRRPSPNQVPRWPGFLTLSTTTGTNWPMC